MSTSAKSYIIIGAGVFGASSAYHLAKDVPSAASSITLLDRSPFPCPLAASYDYQKVIRPDYTNLFHMRLAIKAQELWRSDPLWSRFYHESGIVKLEQGDTGRQMVENYKRLGVPSKAYITDPTTIQKDYPLFRDAEWSQAQDCFVNPESGWAEATAALKAATEAALSLGVHYVDSGASKLLFDDNGHCCGVETEDGRSLRASHIILATGANTAKLIADSAPHRPEMQLEDRLLGCGVLTAAVKLTEEQADHFKAMPVFIHRVGGVLGKLNSETPKRGALGDLSWVERISNKKV
jgi:sarcosine oxidase / L-pipecolate oxidase